MMSGSNVACTMDAIRLGDLVTAGRISGRVVGHEQRDTGRLANREPEPFVCIADATSGAWLWIRVNQVEEHKPDPLRQLLDAAVETFGREVVVRAASMLE